MSNNVPQHPANRNSTLHTVCIKYSGRTSWNIQFIHIYISVEENRKEKSRPLRILFYIFLDSLQQTFELSCKCILMGMVTGKDLISQIVGMYYVPKIIPLKTAITLKIDPEQNWTAFTYECMVGPKHLSVHQCKIKFWMASNCYFYLDNLVSSFILTSLSSPSSSPSYASLSPAIYQIDLHDQRQSHHINHFS